ncbi:MAG: type II secretion system protein GspM [Pseudohongiellaceae bacterium]
MMRSWFLRQSRRDQLALLIGGVLVTAVLLWLAVLSPLQQAVQRSEVRHRSALGELAEVRELVTSIRALEDADDGQISAGEANVATLLDRTAGEYGLRVTALEPAGTDGVSTSLRIRSAAAESVLRWLGELESTGLLISQLTLTPAADESGQVDLSMRVTR